MTRVLAPVSIECPGLTEGYLDLVDLATTNENVLKFNICSG